MSSSRTLRLAVASVLLTLGLAACGASGGSDSSDKKTTTTVDQGDKKTTTTEGDEEETTTTEGGGSEGDVPSADDLEALLPPASKIGEGWTGPEASEESDSGLDDELDKQCPDATLEEDDEPDAVDQTYTNADTSELRITFDTTMRDLSDQEFADYVSAVDECTASYDDPDTGNHFEVDFGAETSDEVGDLAARAVATIKVTTADGQEITFYSYVYAVKHGPVGFTVQGTDGVKDDGTVVDLDTDLLDPLATQLDDALADVLGD